MLFQVLDFKLFKTVAKKVNCLWPQSEIGLGLNWDKLSEIANPI